MSPPLRLPVLAEIHVLTKPLPVCSRRHEAQDDARGQERRGLHQVVPSSRRQEQTGDVLQVVDGPAEQNVLL